MTYQYSNLWLTVTKEAVGIGYHFCVTFSSAMGVAAFKTAAGLKDYLKRTGLKLEFHRGDKFGTTKEYRMIGQYQIKSFFEIEQIPAGFTTYIDGVNGYYVPCYYGMENGIKTFYHPNPNSENCYKSCRLPLAAHLEFSKAR